MPERFPSLLSMWAQCTRVKRGRRGHTRVCDVDHGDCRVQVGGFNEVQIIPTATDHEVRHRVPREGIPRDDVIVLCLKRAARTNHRGVPVTMTLQQHAQHERRGALSFARGEAVFHLLLHVRALSHHVHAISDGSLVDVSGDGSERVDEGVVQQDIGIHISIEVRMEVIKRKLVHRLQERGAELV